MQVYKENDRALYEEWLMWSLVLIEPQRPH